MWGERPRDYYRRLASRFEGARILDVGCGKKKFPGALGIDVRSNVSADVPHDLDELPWPLDEDSFDLVLIRHCLEHLGNVVATVEELWRVTRPQGTIVVEVPHFSWCEAYTHPGHIHFFSGGSLDYYHPANEHYKARLRIVRRRIYFNDFFKWIGFEAIANRFSHFYERHLAFIFPAGSIVWELEALKEGQSEASEKSVPRVGTGTPINALSKVTQRQT